MDRKFQIIVCLLLAAILVVQIFILQRMPLTYGELRKLSAKGRRNLRLKLPVVRVYGTVDVSGNMEVTNTPLEVEIAR